MLRGSYTGGSLAVTARCPLSQVRPLRQSCMPASRLPSRTGRFPISFRLPRFAEQRPRHPRLCYSSAHPCHSLPLLGAAKQGLRVCSQSISSPRHRRALHYRAFPSRNCAVLLRCVAYAAVLCFSLAPSRGATQSRDIAFQSPRPANLGGALPPPCHVSLCLRQALLRKATPSQPVSVHRRCMPRLCFAVALHSAALRRGAVAARGPSWPSYPMPLRFGSLPVLRGAVRSLLLLRHARPRSAYPSPI